MFPVCFFFTRVRHVAFFVELVERIRKGVVGVKHRTRDREILD
jgi:hypothetical protein